MDGLLEPSPISKEERESHLIPMLVGLGIVLIVVGLAVFFLREKPKVQTPPPAYAANVKISDLKTSAAENFVGATVNYLDGTVTNAGDKTLTHAVVRVTFRDSMGQVAQIEELPLRILEKSARYDDAIDLSTSPLAPGASSPFRLTFEHISAEWNHEYPQVQVINVSTK
jgi:Protein of unknown function (DUF2393)